ncbi:FBLN7 protein, partial [Amia calva]|nr:FBLN7 protein [Amia calva]
MEKFLKGQETRFAEGLRIMKSKLAALQNSVSKFPASEPHAVTCPPLEAPPHGRKFGSKYFLGHEVHFACNSGYHLVGAGTRVCQENGSWTGMNSVCKDVSECASNPCQNGGSCVEGVNQYKCTCPQNWSGSHCQHQTQTDSASHAVFILDVSVVKYCSREHRVLHPTPGTGPRSRPYGALRNRACLHADVNECEVYKQDGAARLCMHACVNIPGSYRCSCPTGYRLLADGRSCEDVDECLAQQHNCTRGTTCINTGGGFQCVSPECPKSHGNISYVKTSPLKDPPIPGADWIVTERNKTVFIYQTGELILVQRLRGPQETEVEVDMSEYLERTFQAKHVSKVTVFVSPHEF